MKIQDLLRGQTSQAQQALDDFFANIDVERILWYPSAGKDYRDVMEMTHERLALHQIPEAPNIICHTDYAYRWTGLDRDARCKTMHSNAHTTVRVIEKHPLVFTAGANIRYQIRTENISGSVETDKPIIYLLKLKIKSDTLGEIHAHVFYFIFENYNFLEELILKKRLAITHFVKVRQGCGFGGCRKCISVFYSLLANIGVRYLLVDAEVHYCMNTHHSLAWRHRIRHKNYQLQRIGIPLNWSGYHVRAFQVEPLSGALDDDSFNASLSAIARDWSGEPCRPRTFFPIQREPE